MMQFPSYSSSFDPQCRLVYSLGIPSFWVTCEKPLESTAIHAQFVQIPDRILFPLKTAGPNICPHRKAPREEEDFSWLLVHFQRKEVSDNLNPKANRIHIILPKSMSPAQIPSSHRSRNLLATSFWVTVCPCIRDPGI